MTGIAGTGPRLKARIEEDPRFGFFDLSDNKEFSRTAGEPGFDKSHFSDVEEVEKLKRELRFAIERADNAERAKGSEISAMLAKYNREMADLEEALRVCFNGCSQSFYIACSLQVLTGYQNKTRTLDEIRATHGERDRDQDAALQEKDDEIEVYKSGMEQALVELEELKLVR